jgi:hypothetical protein
MMPAWTKDILSKDEELILYGIKYYTARVGGGINHY